ncbi:diguanylate phosphodiesterase [Amycolatopsis antarctica]|uniref:Diguanylate phosphodiesterase n=1 Tax=Amycolatopsis antarctica TaxID=1854586 RepID=A0A263DAF9_9PSEU|nr:EAL domain-containing protein [Amycolatopsis antarctica]OZM74365.1 diguanylate phosphodiesterase [Amycolatopsis antarctica]
MIETPPEGGTMVAGGPDSGDRVTRSPRRPRAFHWFARLTAVTGLLLAGTLAWASPWNWDAGLWWLAPVLMAAFLLVEHFGFEVDVDGVGWKVTFSEPPLLIGLLLMPFPLILAVHLLAGGVFLLLNKVRDRYAYNFGVRCVEVGVAYLTYSAAIGAHWPPVAAAALGAATVPVLSILFALLVLPLLGPGLPTGAALRLASRVILPGMLNAGVGGLLIVLATTVEDGLLLALPMLVGVMLCYYTYGTALRDHRDVRRLSQASRSVTAALDPTAHGERAMTEALERVRRHMSAHRVVLWPYGGDAEPRIAGAPLAAAALCREDELATAAGPRVRYVHTSDCPRTLCRSLRLREATECLLVELRVPGGPLGVLEVHDRESRWRGFGPADEQALTTLASALGNAIANARMITHLRHNAYYDPLTGLRNRDGLRAAVSVATGTTVLRVEVDAATTATALSPKWGAALLCSAAERLTDLLPTATVATIERGKFVAVVPPPDPDTGGTGSGEPEPFAGVPGRAEDAEELAEYVQRALAEPYTLGSVAVQAGTVVGVATAGAGDEGEAGTDEAGPLGARLPGIDDLVHHAGMAIGVARSVDRPVHVYRPSMGVEARRQLEFTSQIREAIADGQIHVHYQPKISLSSGQVLGAEALVRWQHPHYGALRPDVFIPALERTGRIGALTEHVLEQGLRTIAGWLEQQVRMSVAVNLSARSLADSGFPELVGSALREHGVPPELLTFELTESAVMEDRDRALPIVQRLHDLGVRISIDDFGTGYSSLAYLRDLPVDEVKIDRGCIAEFAGSPGDSGLVRTVLALGHTLGLVVVAEGVEDPQTRDALISLECDIVQGYLYSRPLPLDAFGEWLTSRTRLTGPATGAYRVPVVTPG